MDLLYIRFLINDLCGLYKNQNGLIIDLYDIIMDL
jgi:hypothetical protein